MACVSFSLYVPTLIPSSVLPVLTPHYQRYSSITNQSDCQPGILFTPLCLVCQQLLLETDWLSQVPTLTVRLPATDFDPGTFPCSHHCKHFFSGFREMKPLAFVLRELFRGSIPSLALWLTSSFTPALCSLLPFRTRSLVLNWWLAFIQAGLSSLLMPASLAHSYLFLQSFSITIDKRIACFKIHFPFALLSLSLANRQKLKRESQT